MTARRRELNLRKLATLEKARSNPDLRSDEQPILESSISAYKRELALLDLRSSIAAGDRDARRRALDVVLGRAYRPRVRLQAVVMAAPPAVAGRLLRRQAAASWVGAAGLRVCRD